MDKQSIAELQTLVSKQKEQLTRYENRLRDLLTAYKGLLKEKEALEISLATFSKNVNEKKSSDVSKKTDTTKAAEDEEHSVCNNKIKQLEIQLATGLNSLATLSAEKSRMEASFQADKKHLRLESDTKDKLIRDLKESLKKVGQKTNTELETLKSKLIIERHDREKEQNDHGVMIRELQKLLNDERHLKEQLDMQITDLKAKLYAKVNEADQKFMDIQNDVCKNKTITKNVDNDFVETNIMLAELQNEISMMKRKHVEALEQEKERARAAEEKSRSLAALHEERVANLEARLAELSDTVGAYDRLRQNDLSNIQKLKDEIENLCKSQNTNCKDQVDFNDSEDFGSSGVHTILAKILKLKKILLFENDRLEKPIDLSNVFSHAIDHSKCKDEYNKLMQEYYEYKTKTQSARSANVSFEVSELKSHIKSLQDEIIILNGQIDKNEVIYNASLEEKTQNLIAQKNHYKQLIYDIENNFKEHVSQLEKQLQKQRDRSIGLLEEKEHEIKTLKESFEIFLPGNSKLYLDKCKQKTEQVDSHNLHQLNNVLQGGPSITSGESPHMLHYAHELARKDVDITVLRRTLRELDEKYRDAIREKTLAEDSWIERERKLLDNISRLERSISREGANLEYLKNVVLSYILSTDTFGRSHMLNAIAAVLQFSPEEMEKINKHNTVKLYSNTSA